jgi:hypothetical protein
LLIPFSDPLQHGPGAVRESDAAKQRDACPFLELPAELRNRIYELALGGQNLHMFARDY